MNAETAIKRIKQLFNKAHGEDREALDVALKRLDKDIVVKPNLGKHYGYSCPMCGNEIASHFVDGRVSYCDECSQAISWKGV